MFKIEEGTELKILEKITIFFLINDNPGYVTAYYINVLDMTPKSYIRG